MMIKVIAFDFVGVLVTEKDIELTNEEDKLERLFGDNIDDSSYLMSARNIIKKDSIIIRMTEDIIEKLYQVKDNNIFDKIKSKFHDIKIVIATNHVSFVRNYIGEHLGVDYLDDIIISAEVHKTKPSPEFFQLLLDKYKINPGELLFVDDSQRNIDGAKTMKINTIKVDKNMNVCDTVINYLNSSQKK